MVLGSLLVNIGGYYLVYNVYRAGIKQEMMAYLVSHDDSSIGSYFNFKLSGSDVLDPDFQWEDDQNEFRYKGELYDVVAKSTSNGSIQLNALKDARENNLEKELSKLHRQTNDESSSGSATLLKLFSFYCLPVKEVNEITNLVSLTTYGDFANPEYPAVSSQVIYPPPQA